MNMHVLFPASACQGRFPFFREARWFSYYSAGRSFGLPGSICLHGVTKRKLLSFWMTQFHVCGEDSFFLRSSVAMTSQAIQLSPGFSKWFVLLRVSLERPRNKSLVGEELLLILIESFLGQVQRHRESVLVIHRHFQTCTFLFPCPSSH